MFSSPHPPAPRTDPRPQQALSLAGHTGETTPRPGACSGQVASREPGPPARPRRGLGAEITQQGRGTRRGLRARGGRRRSLNPVPRSGGPDPEAGAAHAETLPPPLLTLKAPEVASDKAPGAGGAWGDPRPRHTGARTGVPLRQVRSSRAGGGGRKSGGAAGDFGATSAARGPCVRNGRPARAGSRPALSRLPRKPSEAPSPREK